MSNELVRKLNNTLQMKSLNDLVRVKTSETVTLLLDASGSMGDRMRNGKRRIDGLKEVVDDIIKGGHAVKMIVFNGAEFGRQAWVTTSAPLRPRGGTPMHAAIDLARAENCGRGIIISDGMPDDPSATLAAAKTFGGQLDVVFVGDPGEYGEEFLKTLAKETGGTEFHGDLSQPKELGAAIIGLLGTGNDDDEDDDGPIQL